MMFQDRDGNQAHPYLTSWGITTRVIGAIVAVHGDQKGIIMPPKLAPYQVVIVPILKGDQKESVIAMAHTIKDSLQDSVRVIVDDDASETPGAKFYRWEMKGVPLRVEIGPKDMEQNQAVIVDRINKHKEAVAIDALPDHIQKQLKATQSALFKRAQEALNKQWHVTEKLDEFGPALAEEAGLYQTGWCGCTAGEEALKPYHGTIRCILGTLQASVCFYCDNKSTQDVMIAKAY
jgi:prolyl-tRNA synthetase